MAKSDGVGMQLGARDCAIILDALTCPSLGSVPTGMHIMVDVQLSCKTKATKGSCSAPCKWEDKDLECEPADGSEMKAIKSNAADYTA